LQLNSTLFFGYSIALFLFSFACAYIILPKIRALASVSNFISEPTIRSSHKDTTPNIGGLSFFIVLMVFYYFIHQFDNYNLFPSLIPGLTILFLIGLKDDLVMVNPSTKIIAQLLASFFFVFQNPFSIINFRGFLWVFEISPILGTVISIILTVVLINAFNLLDGIDGFAALIGLLIFSFYFIFYSYLKFYFLSFINIIFSGALLAFLRYNISIKQKIFMGDTGSMIIGFMVSIMTVIGLSLKYDSITIIKYNFPAQNLPFLLFSVLFIPFFDTFRVFFLRIVQKKNPFHADRQHIHHIFLDYLGWSHIKVSLLLTLINFVLVCFFIFLLNLVDQTIYFLLIIGVILSLFILLQRMSNKIRNYSNS
jgi:UDP-N-acetylmuramyl pentapeptide phosphotransferase/UDP-N-acetylglucosamine-1-phosphate transferase